MRFPLVGLSIPSVPWCWQHNKWKNLLTMSNYSLKHNGVTITHTHTHIHLYLEIVWLFIVFQRQTNYQAGAVFFCNSIFQRVRLLLERQSVWRDFFWRDFLTHRGWYAVKQNSNSYSPVFIMDIGYLLP